MTRSYATTVLLGLLLLSGQRSAAQTPDRPALIQAEVSQVRSARGKVGCLLFASADGFPAKPEAALRRVFVSIDAGKARCVFADLPAGRYAVLAMHDENGNGAMDKTFVGKPEEGHAASRDAQPGFMRGPKFEDAAFEVKPGSVTRIALRLHYP